MNRRSIHRLSYQRDLEPDLKKLAMHITANIIPITALTWTLVFAACGPAPADESSGGSTAAAGTSAGSTVAPTTTGPDGSTTAASTTELATSMASTGAGSTAAETFIVFGDGGCGGVLPDGQKLRCSPEDCDPIEQNCGPGKKCVPWSSSGSGAYDADRCVEVTGDGVVGEPCTVQGNKLSGVDDCAFGHICWKVDDDLHGTCIAQCTGTQADPQCPAGSTCVITNGNALAVCLQDCDPLKQDCMASELCLPNFMQPGFICAPDASGREGQTNDACDFANGCDPGLLCGGPTTTSSACPIDSNGCCTPFCSFPGGACPNPDQQCVSFFAPDPPPPGDEDIGVCKLP